MEEKIKHRVQTYSESKNSFFYKLIKKIILDAREKFFDYFKNLTEYNDNKSLLDIGTTPSLDSEQNVILEKIKNNKSKSILPTPDMTLDQTTRKKSNKKARPAGPMQQPQNKDVLNIP